MHFVFQEKRRKGLEYETLFLEFALPAGTAGFWPVDSGGGGEGGRSLWDYMLCRAIFLGHQWTDAIMRKDLIKEGPFLHLLATLPADSLALWALQGLLWPATDRILAQVSPA